MRSRRSQILAVLLAVSGLLALALAFGRGQPGTEPAPDPAFRSSSLAPLGPLPDEPFSMVDPPVVGDGRDVVFLLFVDGLSPEVFEALLEDGQLPTLAALLEDHPSCRGRALGTFPSSTAPAIPELLTGVWSHRFLTVPDKIHAFDRGAQRLRRHQLEEARWDGVLPTLFDHVAASGGETISYFEGYFGSAALNVHEEAYYLLDLATDRSSTANLLDYDRRMTHDLASRLAEARQPPNLVFLRFSCVDMRGHVYGSSSEEYREAIRSVDRLLGELVGVLKLATLPGGDSLYDRATFVLFSDHGMADTPTLVDLDAALREMGFDPMPTADIGEVILSAIDTERIEEHDALSFPGGSNIAYVYLRDRHGAHLLGWNKAPHPDDLRAFPLPNGPVDVAGELAGLDGVDTVLVQAAPTRFRIEGGERGAATVHLRYLSDGSWTLGYEPDDAGEDPLALCSSDLAEGLCCRRDVEGELPSSCFHTVDTWFAVTADQPLPAAPFFVAKAFSGVAPERPDLIVTGEPGVGFMAQSRGNHGNMQRDSVEIPVLVAGPRVRASTAIEDAWLIDLYPTLMKLFGLETDLQRYPGDGEALPIWIEDVDGPLTLEGRDHTDAGT